MGWIGRFFGTLWQIARGSHFKVHPDLRQGSAVSALYLFMWMVFGIVGVILVLLGFDLGDVDLWLDAQGGWLDILGKWILRLIWGGVLLACAAMVVGGLWQRTRPKGEEDRIGWGVMLAALVLGYFAWFGVVG